MFWLVKKIDFDLSKFHICFVVYRKNSFWRKKFRFVFITDEAVNLTSESHDPNARVNHLRKKEERKRPSREHQCGAGQIPSEC